MRATGDRRTTAVTTNELLAVIDREADLLEADNWHAAAAIMREAAEHLRARAKIELHARLLEAVWSGTVPAADWADPSPTLRGIMGELAKAVRRVPHHATPATDLPVHATPDYRRS